MAREIYVELSLNIDILLSITSFSIYFGSEILFLCPRESDSTILLSLYVSSIFTLFVEFIRIKRMAREQPTKKSVERV